MALAAGKALMELRVAMCQTGAGSAGVRCAPKLAPCAWSASLVRCMPQFLAVRTWCAQGVLRQELCINQGREHEASDLAARVQRDRRQGHRYLRCAEVFFLCPPSTCALCSLSAAVFPLAKLVHALSLIRPCSYDARRALRPQSTALRRRSTWRASALTRSVGR